ncbi:putative FtsX like permease family [Trypanosoma vivax]|uniref:ABC3 transporter permease C-terminal domain-containing protein n=1 Tax=Trypanosoma vivax (strain Y486) TaxID=1055687 RepID=G0TUF1_TRYVY|nr:hypothetical protein TRVL_01606 [Trypanosoma vivax]KAH8607428.1 putative FtsX like permease family [Trypanosoma vivax]CCC47585.1 conserved hypothetical protein [Trypanosoma vivax Y486]
MTKTSVLRGTPNKRLAVDLAEHDASVSFCTRLARAVSELRKALRMAGVFFGMALADIKVRKAAFWLSFASVTLVVFLCLVTTSTLSNLPALFLKMGEGLEGENDLFILPGGEQAESSSLNYSLVESHFQASDRLRGYHTPRIFWTTGAVKMSSCEGIKDASDLWRNENNTICKKDCVVSRCSVPAMQANLIALHQEKEKRMGFGTLWKVIPLGRDEVIISSPVAFGLGGAKVGDTLILYADVGQTLREAFKGFVKPVKNVTTIMQVTVVAVVEPDESKIPSKEFILVNFLSTMEMVAQGLSPEVSEENRREVSRMDPRHCATSIHFNMELMMRSKVYVQPNYDLVHRSFYSWALSILEPMGIHRLRVEAPLLDFLRTVRFFALFLGMTFSLTLTMLGVLSVLLIHSQLNTSIETQVRDWGIRRMLGFSTASIILMILMRAFVFALPATACGLVVGQLFYMLLRLLLKGALNIYLPGLAPLSSFLWATLAGLLLPIVGSIVPIHLLMSQLLSESLNANRAHSTAVSFKLSRGAYSTKQRFLIFLIGALFAILGASIFYFFPVGMLQWDLPLVFLIFFAVVVGMLTGMGILTLNLEHAVQTAVGSVCLFWENSAILQTVKKSLVTHRVRNRRTTLMYTLSLGFIIHASVSSALIMDAQRLRMLRNMGSDVVISTKNMDFVGLSKLAFFIRIGLPEVVGLTYIANFSYPNLPVKQVSLSTIGRHVSQQTEWLHGVPPNYFEVLERRFLSVEQRQETIGRQSLAGSLYTGGRNKIMISTAVYNTVRSRFLQDPLMLVSELVNDPIRNNITALRYAVEPTAVIRSSPQVRLTKFLRSGTTVLGSIPSIVRWTGVDFASVRCLNIGKVSLKLGPGAKAPNVAKVIGMYLQNELFEDITVLDRESHVKSLRSVENGLTIFFVFIELMTLLVCYFALVSNVAANVFDSTKEIGIYRCIGMTSFQVYRILIWETFLVVISSGLLGSLIGLLLGYSTYLQSVLFSELDIPFPFPFVVFSIIVGTSFIAAFVATHGPASRVLALSSISAILRRG